MYKVDSIIFDLDGTLWDSTDGIVKTWGLVLSRNPDVDKVVTEEDLSANIGLPVERIAANMFPQLPKERQLSLMDDCCRAENIYLAQHGGTLFPDEMDVLEKLSAAFPLFVVSNCQTGYIESFYEGNKTARFFKDQECIGNTGLSKGENIRLVMQRNNLQCPVYVGDTQGDADAAALADIPFVYAAYGFGSVDHYDWKLDSIADLLKFIKNRE